MQHCSFILATDLDGTFLGGSDSDRTALYDWIEDNRATVGLIFVTGRDLPFIGDLCNGVTSHGRVPWPDYVVGDVGTTIAEVDHDAGPKAAPVPVLETEIASLWSDKGDEVRAALSSAAGLKLQETPFRYRVSYHYDPEAYDPEAEKIIRDMGLDVLISDNRFFDVLPPGVSKGPSLLRLVEHLAVDHDRVLVAGDTLNDFSLFATGLNGVAVGNSEAGLLSRIDEHPTADTKTHRARGDGTAGIMEAIRHYDFMKDNGATLNV